MGFFKGIFGKYLPADAAAKDQVGGALERLKGVHEMMADVVEATEKLDVVAALAKASPWAEAVGTALGDALPPVRFVLKLFEELGKIEDPGELGYLAATLAYERAVEQALPELLRSEVGKRIGVADAKVRKSALGKLRKATPPDAYDFASFSFETALSSKFIEDADRFLELGAQGLGLDEAGFLIFQHEVRRRFVPNLKGVLSHGSTRERFAPFRELMALDTLEARAYDALLEHADYQRWLFEEKPVLGREPFTLKQVYTETDCGILRWEQIRKQDRRVEHMDPFLEKHGGRHPLVESVLDLVADLTFKDAIVIQGVAGSGKSSLTLRLAWELVRQGLRPIRIELKHLDTRESAAIEEALPEAVHVTSSERTPGASELLFGKDLFLDGSIFKESVSFRGVKVCPYVLLLDGWDEISIGAAEGYQQRVARMLEGVRRKFLERPGFPVRVILTGRPTETIEASRFMRDDTRLLTVRNFSPTQLESYVEKVEAATAAAAKRGETSWSLAQVKSLPKIVERYRQQHDDELARKVDGQAGNETLARLMISFFFKGGRRELGAEFSHKSFRKYLFAEQVVEVLKEYGRRVCGKLPERMREEHWKDFDDHDPRKDLCHRLAELLGPVWVTPEVARHLRRLLAWEIARAVKPDPDRIGEPTMPLKMEQWERIRDGLADAWDWWGEGVHLRPQPIKRQGHWDYDQARKSLAEQIVEDKRLRSDRKRCPTPVRTTSVDAHLGDGLFLLTATAHAEIACLKGHIATSRGPGEFGQSGEDAGVRRRYQRSLAGSSGVVVRFAPSGSDPFYFFNYCARINAAGYRLSGPFPSRLDLRQAYLSGAYLAGLNFRGAYLGGTDFAKADLRGVDLGGVDLSGANLRETNLCGAYLQGAILISANLGDANLRGAVLAGVNLRAAYLRRAYLFGADLRVANIRRADLREADLTCAYLGEADLSGADLREAKVDRNSMNARQKDQPRWS